MSCGALRERTHALCTTPTICKRHTSELGGEHRVGLGRTPSRSENTIVGVGWLGTDRQVWVPKAGKLPFVRSVPTAAAK